MQPKPEKSSCRIHQPRQPLQPFTPETSNRLAEIAAEANELETHVLCLDENKSRLRRPPGNPRQNRGRPRAHRPRAPRLVRPPQKHCHTLRHRETHRASSKLRNPQCRSHPPPSCRPKAAPPKMVSNSKPTCATIRTTGPRGHLEKLDDATAGPIPASTASPPKASPVKPAEVGPRQGERTMRPSPKNQPPNPESKPKN